MKWEANMTITSLTAGRYFKLGNNTWATTEGGLSYVSGEKVNFERTEVTSSNVIIVASTTSNYQTTKETKSTVGVAARADLTWVSPRLWVWVVAYLPISIQSNHRLASS